MQNWTSWSVFIWVGEIPGYTSTDKTKRIPTQIREADVKLKPVLLSNRVKRQTMEWEKILASHVSDKELISRIKNYNSRTKKSQ